MLKKEVDIKKNRPVPISVLIQTTNKFVCDIFIQCSEHQIDAKNYDDVKQNLVAIDSRILFCFSGYDELKARTMIENLFRQ